MSSNSTHVNNPSTESGISAVLKYTGIPQSWIKRPKLPSRNWLIFLSTTASVLGLYVYDRRKCKEIRQKYIDRVKHLADEPLQSLDLVRKVTVYGCKWPGDEDSNKSIKYFKKYLKPILVAAAIDYDIVNGKRHGDLADIIAGKIQSRRRIESGLEGPPSNFIPAMFNAQINKDERELAGGSIIIGRHTFKEYMAGLKRGWSDSLENADLEEYLSHELANDGHFDEPESASSITLGDIDGEPIPTSSRLQSLNIPSGITALKAPRNNLKASEPQNISPPDTIPQQPTLLLVPFTNYIGLRLIPLMVFDFFYQRAKVESGASEACKLIFGSRRPIVGPQTSGDVINIEALGCISDLDFDRQAESYYKSSTESLPSEITKAREEYYKALPKKLETARALARGTREPTADEKNFPPPTEVELRAERLKKELRWRGDLKGWAIVKPSEPVAWDERFSSALSVFTDIAKQEDNTLFTA